MVKKSARNVITEEEARRTSFERFGDDLTELILTYVRLEDRIRLRCVCRQWRRLAFNKQSLLIAGESNHNINAIVKLVSKSRFRSYQTVIAARLRSVLKMCPNVKAIDLGSHIIDNSVLDIIKKCCPHLESIVFCTKKLTLKDIKCFGKHFALQLKCVRFQGFNFDVEHQSLLFGLCPNVAELTCDEFWAEEKGIANDKHITALMSAKKLCLRAQTFDKNLLKDIKQLAPNLTHLELSVPWSSLFIESNMIEPLNNLKVFKIKTVQGVGKLFFNQIPSFVPNIRKLKIRGKFIADDNILAMLAQLNKIKWLTLEPTGRRNNLTDDGICYLLDNCPSLKKIKFHCCLSVTYETIDKLIEIAIKRPLDMIILKCRRLDDESITCAK